MILMFWGFRTVSKMTSKSLTRIAGTRTLLWSLLKFIISLLNFEAVFSQFMKVKIYLEINNFNYLNVLFLILQRGEFGKVP